MRRTNILTLLILASLAAISHLTFAKPSLEAEESHTIYLPVIGTGCAYRGVPGRGATTNFDAAWTQEMIEELGLSWQYTHDLPEDWQTKFECIENVPMIWCASENYWARWVERVPATYRGPIILFNEWLNTDQCNASLEMMVEIYGRMVERHSPEQIVFGNFVDYESGFGWVNFLAFHQGIVDAGHPFHPLAIGVHDYRSHTNIVQPSEQIDSLINMLDREGLNREDLEIWITEYGSTSQYWFEVYTSYYEQHPKITRWAAFEPCTPPDYFLGVGLFEAEPGWTPGQIPNTADGTLICSSLNTHGKLFSGILD